MSGIQVETNPESKSEPRSDEGSANCIEVVSAMQKYVNSEMSCQSSGGSALSLKEDEGELARDAESDFTEVIRLMFQSL